MVNSNGSTPKKKAPGKPWQPGQSGNPSGRRKGSVSLKVAVERELLKNPDRLKRIARHVLDVAEHAKGSVKDSMQACSMVWGYLDGKPTQHIEHAVAPEERAAILRAQIAEARGMVPTPEN